MMTAPTGRRGRPPKFHQRGRPVTVTLPDTTLARLAAIDPDRSRAIVKATEAAVPAEPSPEILPDLIEVAPGIRVIMVGPSRSLRQIEWLRLLEVAPSRYLLIIPTGTAVDSLELALIDLLDTVGDVPWETAVLQRLRGLIADLRRASRVSKAELLLVEKAKS
jgi:hypothetical protein